MCTIMPTRGVNKDAMRIRLFMFSLKGDADKQYTEQVNLMTWDDLAKSFLETYFPYKKVKELVRMITNFVLKKGEKLGVGWDRYKQLLKILPEGELNPRDQIDSFFKGLPEYAQMNLNSAARKSLLSVTPNLAQDIIERLVVVEDEEEENQVGEVAVDQNMGNMYEAFTSFMTSQGYTAPTSQEPTPEKFVNHNTYQSRRKWQ